MVAQDIILRGGLWNSFVMVFRLDAMLALLRRHRSDDYHRIRRLDVGAYVSLEAWSFSGDFLAHVPDELAVLRVGDVGWSDWGTPEAIERTFVGLKLVPPWWCRLTPPRPRHSGQRGSEERNDYGHAVEEQVAGAHHGKVAFG